MALQLVYPLKKGTYHRVRGFNAHKIGWKGIDDGCKVGTPLRAEGAGRVSHRQKISIGGGWNFRLNLTKYPGWFVWYAHCSSIPLNGRVFKKGQIIGKSGNTGGSTGPHLHHSLIQGFTPRNPDSKSVVKWEEEVEEVTDKEARVMAFVEGYAAITNKHATTWHYTKGTNRGAGD